MQMSLGPAKVKQQEVWEAVRVPLETFSISKLHFPHRLLPQHPVGILSDLPAFCCIRTA